jgi:hypothetical protein
MLGTNQPCVTFHQELLFNLNLSSYVVLYMYFKLEKILCPLYIVSLYIVNNKGLSLEVKTSNPGVR